MLETLPILNEFDERLKDLNVPLLHRKADFHLFRLESSTNQRIEAPLARFNFFWIKLCLQSDYVHNINGQPNPIVGKMLLFGFPGSVSSFKNDGNIQLIGFTAYFKMDFLYEGIVKAGLIKAWQSNAHKEMPPLPLSDTAAASFKALFEAIEIEYRDSGPHRFDIIRSYLTIILLTIKTLRDRADANYQEPIAGSALYLTEKFQELVALHFSELRSVSAYAERLHTSSKHLSASVKRVTGRSAQFYISGRVLDEAKLLLWRTDLTVQEIAYRLHFHDQAAFFKFFKRHTGHAPLDFRQRKIVPDLPQ